MNSDVSNTTIMGCSKFDTLTIVENGLIIANKKTEKYTILFSEINKIYITKTKLYSWNKIGFLSFVMITVSIAQLYLPMEYVLTLSIFFMVLIGKIIFFKWYKLIVQLNDKTFYYKKFYTSVKHENIIVVNTVRKEIFDHNIISD